MLTITREYKKEDLDRLYELEKTCFTRAFRWSREDLAKALQTSDVWVGMYKNKIAGYALGEVSGDTGHIVSLNVDPESRRMGFGTSLMEAVEVYYKKEGFKKLKLEVHVDNPAQTLYFKLGYRVTGVRQRYYANGSSALTMVKPLKK